MDEIPGIGPVAAIILAETGFDMSRFPTAGHVCSWAKFFPDISASAGKSKGNGSTGHGNLYLARVLGEAVVVVGRTGTFLGERYRRIARTSDGGNFHVIVWHLLQDPDPRFGADHFSRQTNPDTSKRNHVRQLEAIVTPSP